MGCGQSGEPKKQAQGGGGAGGGGGGKAQGAGAGNNFDEDKKKAKSENKQFSQAMEFIKKVPLFKGFPPEDLPLLADAFESCSFKVGQVLVKQGDDGNEFFIIKKGEAKVVVQEGDQPANQLAVLKIGDYFGEMALLRNTPRTATITAESVMECVKIRREKFMEQGLNMKIQFANRNAVGVGNVGLVEVKEPTPKTAGDKSFISKALLENQALTGVVNLDQERINKLMEKAWLEDVPAGTDLIVEGDLKADYFYIVKEGEFKIHTSAQETDGDKGREDKVVKSGGTFGELALLYLTPRAATVKENTAGGSKVWVIDRNNFKDVLMQVSDKKVQEYSKMIEKVDAFKSMLGDERKKVAKAMVEIHFSKGEVIIQQGEVGSTFYILYDGKVEVQVDGKKQAELTASASDANAAPQIFGEKALIKEETRAATVVVKSEAAKALALDSQTFKMLLQPMKELMESRTKQDDKRTRIQRKDLKKLGLLGCGGFGTVELWQHNSNEQTYAMKALSKGYIVKTGMQESVMNEKNILHMTNSPFVIKLFETFNGQQSLYFLLEPALGGELYATYNRKGLHGSETHARFYIAGTLFAFEHIHERHIIYRDLKPENLLLANSGQIKLTDMGLAKFVIGKTFTTCGTPDYFAPEIISSTGHTNAVDWWTLGILLFELLSGRPPFESAYPMQTYSKVMKGISKIEFPAKCRGEVESVIKGLLKREPNERIPARSGGTKNLKEVEWYRGFDWEKMKNCEIDPPYKPVVKNPKDFSNFSARAEDMPKQLEYKPDGSNWDKDFATSQ